MLIEKESETKKSDLDLIRQLFSRTALNFKTKLDFLETTEAATDDLCQQILTPRNGPHFYQKDLQPLPGEQISPPKKITVFNGSPRGKNGNTPIMLRQLMEGFGGDYEIHDLIITRDLENQIKAFEEAECVWIGFPLYTDGMPGVVKSFIEALEPYQGRKGNPPMGFLIQSGFPEGLHSRYVERYNARLAELLGAPYLGTIIKGGGEGIRLTSDEMNARLFENLHVLGGNLARGEVLDPDVLADIAKPERFPAILGPIFRLFLRTKMAHSYFDNMLLENEAFERRNDQPFVEG
jgi:hypothetical protein